MTVISSLRAQTAGAPAVRRVPLTQPFSWVSKGWDDLLQHKGASLGYGLLVSVLGALILSIRRHPYLLAAAVTGFLLVGPILTAGLCELSRLRDEGQPANFQASGFSAV